MGVKNRRTSRVRFDLTKRLAVSGVKRIGNTPSGPRNPPSGPASESGGMSLGLAAFIGGCLKGLMRPFFIPQGQNPRRSSRWHPEQFGVWYGRRLGIQQCFEDISNFDAVANFAACVQAGQVEVVHEPIVLLSAERAAHDDTIEPCGPVRRSRLFHAGDSLDLPSDGGEL
jgi:hypothetical protein